MQSPPESSLLPIALRIQYASGAGWQIDADIADRVSFLEYAMKPGWKPILHGRQLMAYEPWTGPFTPKVWDDMIERMLTEMVTLWNEKHSKTAYAESLGYERLKRTYLEHEEPCWYFNDGYYTLDQLPMKPNVDS